MTSRPLTGDTRTRLRETAARLYTEGCTIHSVARQIGYSYSTARILLIEARVQLRRPGHWDRAARR